MPNNVLVAIEGVPYSADKFYEYAVPQELSGVIAEGSIVFCPFGGGNRKVRGIVVQRCDASGVLVKEISGVYDLCGYLGIKELRLCAYMKSKYFCTFFDAAKTVMPPGVIGSFDRYYQLRGDCEDEAIRVLFAQHDGTISQKALAAALPKSKYYQMLAFVREGVVKEILKFKNVVSDQTLLTAALTPQAQTYILDCNEKHRTVLEFLKEHGPCAVKEILYMTGLSNSVLKTLKKHGVITLMPVKTLRNPLKNRIRKTAVPPVLNDSQQRAADEICLALGTGKTHLLYGVTGSGKTHVFMQVIDRVLARGESALVLLPEISLTLQIIERFYDRYGDILAILHSALSVGERYDEYLRIRSGAARVVVGTRSAVFAPMQRLGIIIIDEEQEHTYKSDMSPRYNARDVAAFLVRQNKSLLLLASATPSFESYSRALSGAIGFSKLGERFNCRPLPKTLVADMTMEHASGNLTVISALLATELQKNLERAEQAILFMNRRGYNSIVTCPQCKFVYSCPNCGIPMTYHQPNDRLVCHYCGHSLPAAGKCPSCGSATLRYSGFGTQKVEAELKKYFPQMRVLRMDADTVGAKASRDQILSSFARGEYDVLLGTQMITKGLDFSNVTLVGVLSADMSLYSSDFRAYEKTFALLTQVTGRAGRAEKEGRAVIQTYSPEHIVLEYAFKQDYEGFYKEETALRKALVYPPFCDVCQVVFLADDLRTAFDGAEAFVHKVEMLLQEAEFSAVPISIIRPRQTSVPKVGGRDRVRVLIKCRDNALTRRLLDNAYIWFLKEKSFKDMSISLDINPSMIV